MSDLREAQRSVALNRSVMADWSGRAERTAQQGGGNRFAGMDSAGTGDVNATAIFILDLSTLDGSDTLG